MRFLDNIKFLVPLSLRLKWHMGCYKCGSLDDLRFPYTDDGTRTGKRVEYCTDCWPGYDSCAFPGCHHYRCEHSSGETWETIYVKDGQPGEVGDKIEMLVGCMNAGCDDCPGFMEPGTYTVLSDSGYAKRSAYWALSEMPHVIGVEGSVEVTVNMYIKLDVYSYEAREAIYQKQFELMEKHPNVLFNFQLTHGINEHE